MSVSRETSPIEMSSSSDELISAYLDAILEMNKNINLTRITERKEADILHIEDSLRAVDLLNEAPDGLYGDIGTGGGFPGVPLAIKTGRETLLIDSVGKKIRAIDQALEKIGSPNNIGTYTGRIEDLALIKQEEFSVITARALSSLSSLLELASPLLRKHGLLICFKAQVDQEEFERALSLEKMLGMRFLEKKEFILSDNETHRSLLVFEKISSPSIKLPRRIGLAQKHPLSER